jgi:hypothetical protein
MGAILTFRRCLPVLCRSSTSRACGSPSRQPFRAFRSRRTLRAAIEALAQQLKPLGAQLVGKRWDDARLLGVAQALTHVTRRFRRPPGY